MRAIAEQEPLLIFRVGPVLCCARVHDVDSIVVPQKFTYFPGQSEDIAGVFKYRTHTVSVVKLRAKFGLPDHDNEESGRIIMAYTRHGLTGFWADEIEEITSGYEDNLAAPPMYSDGNVFDKTLIWNEHIVLHTDFDALYAMKDARPLSAWLDENAGEEQAHQSADIVALSERTFTETDAEEVHVDSSVAEMVSTTEAATVDPSVQAIPIDDIQNAHPDPERENLSETVEAQASVTEAATTVVDQVATDETDQNNAAIPHTTALHAPVTGLNTSAITDTQFHEALDALDGQTEPMSFDESVEEVSEFSISAISQAAQDEDFEHEEEYAAQDSGESALFVATQEDVADEDSLLASSSFSESQTASKDFNQTPVSVETRVENETEAEFDTDIGTEAKSDVTFSLERETFDFKSPVSAKNSVLDEDHIRAPAYAPDPVRTTDSEAHDRVAVPRSIFPPVRFVASASALVLVAAIAGYVIFSNESAEDVTHVAPVAIQESVEEPAIDEDLQPLTPVEESSETLANAGDGDSMAPVEDVVEAKESTASVEVEEVAAIEATEESEPPAIEADVEVAMQDEAIEVASTPVLSSSPTPLEPLQPQPSPVWGIHTISDGDTLWALAGRYLNNPYRYPDLVHWNKISNPNLIFPGDQVKYKKEKKGGK
ncbi:MAG: chemotaxis protein CheW [Gammaproteobacteria bacterium]|nr:chemotaxis protein CheW [Gammaproteobacteria bacterium]